MSLDFEDLKYNFGCASCGYKVQTEDKPLGTIPVNRVIEKLDEAFSKNDLAAAGRLLSYWQNEAVSLRDRRGELSVVNEQLGYFRKTDEEQKALESVERALQLIELLGVQNEVSSATVYLNAATTLKAFGRADEALPLYETTHSIYQSSLKKDDLLFGGFYNNYGLALADLNRFEEAEQAYNSALQVVLTNVQGRLDAAVTYLNMAHLYEVWDKKSEADIDLCLKKGLEILKDKTILHNGYFAFVLSKCAPSYRHFGLTEVAAKMEQYSEELYARN